MLSTKERAFVEYWAKMRETESRFWRKVLMGLPFAALFCFPILLFLIVVHLFLPDWYAKVSSPASSSMGAIVVALLVATLFISYFRMHFKWEMNEQTYRELLHKMKKDDLPSNQK